MNTNIEISDHIDPDEELDFFSNINPEASKHELLKIGQYSMTSENNITINMKKIYICRPCELKKVQNVTT